MRVLLARIRRFRDEQGGAAAVEFALILPFLILLFMGSIEASSLITVDRRVNVISGTVGDLVARWDGKNGATVVPTNTLGDYFKASQGIMFPYPTTALMQIVSVVKVESNGDTKVKWSCGFNGATKHNTDTAYALPANLKEVVKTGDGWVIASEASYSYTPVLGMVFPNALNLRSESFYLPRFEEEIKFGTCPT